MENLRFYFATYNVGTKPPPDDDLHKLLSLSEMPDPRESLPDFIAISLQEVKAQPHNLMMNLLYEDPWTNEFRRILAVRNYIKVKTIRLQGLLLSLYSLKKHVTSLRDVETEYTRTGLSGIWGNKGAVSVRFSIYGCSVCIVNAHLTAHEDQLDNRIDDYNNIIEDQKFHVENHTNILHHDYVFWMGDLNFRLREEYNAPAETVRDLVKKGELDFLYNYDQLKWVRETGLAFSEFDENQPRFPPTFKFEVGTSDYDMKRRPAWTDRVLFKVNPNNYENITLKMDQLSYKCYDQFVVSDHKPVSSEFNIKVFSRLLDSQVKFDAIPPWDSEEENNFGIQLSADVKDIEGDWIGLYKHDYNSLDDYLCYVYVTKGSSPDLSQRRKHPSETKMVLEFPETNRVGLHRLIYIGQTTDKVQSVLGISDTFNIFKNEGTLTWHVPVMYVRGWMRTSQEPALQKVQKQMFLASPPPLLVINTCIMGLCHVRVPALYCASSLPCETLIFRCNTHFTLCLNF